MKNCQLGPPGPLQCEEYGGQHRCAAASAAHTPRHSCGIGAARPRRECATLWREHCGTSGAPTPRYPRTMYTRGTSAALPALVAVALLTQDRKSTRLNSSHGYISYAVFCLKKQK